MKKSLLVLLSMIGTVSLVSAADNVSYTANDAAGNSDDGLDQNLNVVQVWQQTLTPDGGAGGGFGPWTLTPNYWQIWSYPAGSPSVCGGVTETHTFTGGALAIGQTVSLNWEMSATDPLTDVGVDLLNGSGAAVTFGIYGQEPDPSNPWYTGSGYFYSDAGSGGDVNAGSMSYQYESLFNIAFTITGANTYSAVAGSDSWSGTFAGSIIGIDVFNNRADNESDVAFNNLTVVPEPSTLALVSVGAALLLGYQRRKALRA